MSIRVSIASLDELEVWAKDWSETLQPMHVVLLEGAVGAGKTQLVRFVSIALGAKHDEIASPSYGIHHSYQLPKKDRLSRIEHVDLYRLEDEDDLESTGFWDLFSEKDTIIFIEWAERLEKGVLPPNWTIVRVQIEILGENMRLLVIN